MTEVALTLTERRRSLAAAIGCTAIAGTAMGLSWPLLALVLDSNGASSTMIGLSSATQSLAVFVAAPLTPRLVTRYGLLRVVQATIAITAATLLLLPATADPYAWFPIRFALGAATIALFISTETWVNQIAGDASRGRVIGTFGLLWSAGFAGGPMIIRMTGIDGWAPFLVAAGLVVLASLPLLSARDLTPAIEPGPARRVGALIRRAPAAMLLAPLLGAVDYILDSFLPMFGMQAGLGQDDAVVLLSVLLVGVTAAQLPAGWLADRCDRRRLLTASSVLVVLLAGALPLTAGSPAALFAAVFLLGIALGAMWTLGVVLLGQTFRGTELVTAYAAGGMLHGIGMVAGPLAAGIAVDAWGAVTIPLSVALCALVYLPLTLLRQRGGPDGEP